MPAGEDRSVLDGRAMEVHRMSSGAGEDRSVHRMSMGPLITRGRHGDGRETGKEGALGVGQGGYPYYQVAATIKSAGGGMRTMAFVISHFPRAKFWE